MMSHMQCPGRGFGEVIYHESSYFVNWLHWWIQIWIDYWKARGPEKLVIGSMHLKVTSWYWLLPVTVLPPDHHGINSLLFTCSWSCDGLSLLQPTVMEPSQHKQKLWAKANPLFQAVYARYLDTMGKTETNVLGFYDPNVCSFIH